MSSTMAERVKERTRATPVVVYLMGPAHGKAQQNGLDGFTAAMFLRAHGQSDLLAVALEAEVLREPVLEAAVQWLGAPEGTSYVSYNRKRISVPYGVLRAARWKAAAQEELCGELFARALCAA